MDIFLQQIFNGLVLGSVYALLALGYTMVYGILQLINFAHGEVLMVGAMVALTTAELIFQIHPSAPGAWVLMACVLCAVPACMALSLAVERLAYRPLRQAPRLAPLITAIGVSIVLQTLAMMIWGTNPHVFPDLLPTEPIVIAGAYLAPKQLLILAASAGLLTALLLLVHRTALGRQMRAVAESPSLAGLMGISANATIQLAFMLGAALAAVGGVLMALNYNIVHFTMGFLPGLKAFTAAVLGGIGNLGGAVLGGLVLGLVESLAAGYLGDLTGGFLGSHYQDIVAFGLLILFLLFRPQGILGERLADRP